MLLWDATHLPQGFLDPFSQRLEGFAEANAGSFHVGVGEHKVVHHMRKRFSCNGHTQVLHMGEIGLGSLAGLVSLFKDDFLLRPMHGTPSGNMSLQGPDLGRSIATWVLLTEQRKQGGRVQPLTVEGSLSVSLASVASPRYPSSYDTHLIALMSVIVGHQWSACLD